MRRITILCLFLIIIISCEKEVITIIHETVKVPADSLKPSAFELFVDEVTDTRIKIHWTQSLDETSDVSYDVLLSDSVIAYGSFSQPEYLIINLMPETEYSISVMAVDKELNSYIVTRRVTTKKSFFDRIFSFNPDYYFYRFDKVVSTENDGLLICGRYLENEYSGYVTFLMRLDTEYNVLWYNEYNSGLKDLRQISSGCFLITGSNYVSKIDGNGGELWKCQIELGSGELTTAIENSSGQVLIVGDMWSIPLIRTNYYIAEVSGSGTLIWQKSGSPTRINLFTDIIQKPDGRYLVLGIHEVKGIRSEWLVETDDQGNITWESDYLSSFHDDDQPSRIISWIDGNYLLAGSTTGCLPPFYWVNIIPRFINVSPAGNVIWDKTQSIAFGTSEYFRSYTTEGKYSILFLSSTYEHSAFAWLDQNGNVSNKIILNELPECIFLKKDVASNYVLALADGYVVVINKDGYRE
jgi:hypothetical protein